MQVTINEADRLLRKHYETSPQLFDGEFYLVLGSSLFYLSQLTNRGPEEEEAFIDEAISRLKSALDLCSSEHVNEIQLALCKALYHKVGLMMQSAGQAPEDESQSIIDSASIIMNSAGAYMEAIFVNIFKGKVSDSGKFFDPTQESIDVLGHAQLLADSETTWSSFKDRNKWCQELYRMALDYKDASVQVNANLGVAACYISLSNYYFDNAPQDDSDSDSDSEDANQTCLIAEMNPSVVKDQLTRACEHISVAIDSLGSSSVETKARAYQMQGEAHLNLGNLSSDEAEELKFYRTAVKAFQITKELQPQGLLPDSFESFLEEWACNIE
ncbi:hypothetical protein DSO57_1010857 [Entomophthora muscae]|uniref:Uncharacterized protein n=2 Tax=Entomophthora muscae TaxID=34485 RepID=A0ACC2TTV1_9FUNG|nr:hypothetical protein DSO57_1010857 [Entomophthora muscae]